MCSTSDCKDSKNATCLSTGTTEHSTGADTGTRKTSHQARPINASDCFCVLNAQMLSDVKALSAFTIHCTTRRTSLVGCFVLIALLSILTIGSPHHSLQRIFLQKEMSIITNCMAYSRERYSFKRR